ncbi:hemerythrin domain-containing protein [Nocardioides sp. GY 10113]|uniref:hemerythrin domain-containing protein n=1 Tax=Nocardioides sp. GY 10113 TaxID=2569761 RepID=UPI0010A7E89F|nr:hemerythrin domain-containing protein [Nocardioides sp. GY 10113]TIC87706.1 hemerythrin domain-containing protein [Nocardioides sp. GY 10113]
MSAAGKVGPVGQVDLPGQAWVADGPIDHVGMYAMHYAFRRDLADLAATVPRTAVEDRHAWRALDAYWRLFAELLHHHHTVEDEHYWPALSVAVDRRGDEDDRALVAAMADEHAEIAPALVAVGIGFDAMRRHASVSVRHQVADGLSHLRTALEDHLAHEERETLPLVQRVLDGPAYEDVERAIGRAYPLRLVLTLVPWVTYGLNEEDAAQVWERAGRPHRVVHRLTRRGFERRHRDAFGG